MLQHLCRNTHSLLHGCSHRCPPGSSYRTMWHLPIEHEKPLNTETLSHSHVHFDLMWIWALMFRGDQLTTGWQTWNTSLSKIPHCLFAKGSRRGFRLQGCLISGLFTHWWDMHKQTDSHTTVFDL